MLNVGSLFSGIGGLDEGLRRAGHRHVFFCESDAYRRDVLRARFPRVPVYDDVRLVAGGGEKRGGVDAEPGCGGSDAAATTELRAIRGGESDAPEWATTVDLLCGGFPCQDLSVAGRRAGLAGDRSGLFFEFARIADALRPSWLLVENVPGLLSSNGGRDFGVVLGTLADLGYGVAWRILDSRFFGVPQRRRRVFIVGAFADGDPRVAADRAGAVLAVGSGCERHSKTSRQERPSVAYALADGSGNRTGSGRDGQDTLVAHAVTDQSKGRAPDMMEYVVSPTLQGRRGKRGGAVSHEEPLAAYSGHGGEAAGVANALTRPSNGASWSGNSSDTFVAGSGVRRLTPAECERLQGFPVGWTQLGETPDSRRYSALGDAVTVTVSEWIGKRLVA